MRRIWEAFFCAVLLIAAPIKAFALENPAGTQIVYILDASNSMNTNDPQRLAPDAINQMVQSAISNTEVGFVAFNDKVTEVVPLTGHDGRESLTQAVEATAYRGYTDAGSALETAVSLFSDSSDASKYIVMLSDGEIALDTPEKTDESLQKYGDAATVAKAKGISIFTIGLEDELADGDHSILDAAKKSGGKTYYAPTADDLQTTVNTLLWEDFGFRKQAAASVSATGGEDSIKVKIPGGSAKTARVLLTGKSPLKDIGVNCAATEVKVYSGKRYGIVELQNPQGEAFDVKFIGTKGDRISVELVAEHQAEVSPTVVYSDTKQKGALLRSATVSVKLLDPKNRELNLLSASALDGKQAVLSVNGAERSVTVHDGQLSFERDVTQDEALEIGVTLPDMGVNLLALRPVKVLLEAPVVPKWTLAEKLAVVAGIGIVLAAVLIALLLRRKKSSYQCDANHNYGFYGKLDVYMVWVRGGEYEIPPFTFQLGQLNMQKKISLAQLISANNIQLEFEGAEKIWFFAGPERTLLVKNGSKAEIFYAGSSVGAGENLQLCFGQKVYISFKQDVDEIEIYYRNVKEQMPVGVAGKKDYSVQA